MELDLLYHSVLHNYMLLFHTPMFDVFINVIFPSISIKLCLFKRKSRRHSLATTGSTINSSVERVEVALPW